MAAARLPLARYDCSAGPTATAFRPELFAELLGLEPEAGANSVIRKHREQTRFVELLDRGILLDVDDWGTYRSIN